MFTNIHNTGNFETVNFAKFIRGFGGYSATVARWLKIARLGFLLGGVLTSLFMFPSSGQLTHGTRYVVGHFHIFMVGFVVIIAILSVRSTYAVQSGVGANFLERRKFGRIYCSLLFAFVATVLSFSNIALLGGNRRADMIGNIAGFGRRFLASGFLLCLALFFAMYLVRSLMSTSLELGGGIPAKRRLKPSWWWRINRRLVGFGRTDIVAWRRGSKKSKKRRSWWCSGAVLKRRIICGR
jgi:heme/copper-type cytochrome/quinol oxidase subunit 1